MLDVGKFGEGQEDDREVVEMIWMSRHEQSEEELGDRIAKDNGRSFL